MITVKANARVAGT